MADYYFALKERFSVAEETDAFVFDSSHSTSSGQADFTFRAGQYVEVGLENAPYTDKKRDHRDFSIASSPEDKGIIMVATRMDSPQRPISALKRSMREVPIGTKFKVEGPYGMFTLHENTSKRAVFLAGGIGITPVRSIIKDATERKLPHKIVLIYSNRNLESTAFLDDLKKWEGENTNFKLYAKMTDKEGFVDAAYIKNCVGNLNNTIYYVVGPPAMVGAMTKALSECGISRDDIRFEEFTGY